MQYGRVLGAGILAGLLAACSAQNGNSTGPIPYGGTPPTGVSTVTSSSVGNDINASASAVGTNSQDAALMGTDTTSGSVPKHVLTGDYLGAPDGSTTVTPAKAAPYVNWAQVAYSYANSVHDAGIKVQVYFNPNRLGTSDPLATMLPTSAYADTCSSSRVYLEYKNSTKEWVTNPSSTVLHTTYASYVAQRLAGQHVDAIFEDTAGPLQGYGLTTFLPGTPCSYNANTWLAGERAMEASLSIPTIFNGLSGLNGHDPSLSIGLLSNTKTIGGTYEHCFANTATSPVEGSWVWTAAENTQLQVTAKDKIFQCMAFDTASASTSVPARIYTIASFLMTYNVNYSMLQELFATPNKFHAMPEQELVALNPVVATPASVSSLLAAGGAYVRQYRSCYIAGVLKGACAMVVNPNYNAVAFPTTLSSFHHTLTLAGYDVLEGGTIGTTGAAPPRTLAAESAAVVFP